MHASELFIVGGTVITGDGQKYLPNATVHVVGDRIADIDVNGARPAADRLGPYAQVINAERGFVIPGIVNTHAHGCYTGPVFSSAAWPLDKEHAWRNAERHLAAGVTTLVNVCGLGTAADLQSMADHPLRIFLSTTHFERAIDAAKIVDGAGLSDQHVNMTASQMLQSDTTVAIGEVGSGATLGGGVASYKYVPQAVKEIFGKEIGPTEANQLINALLGPMRQLPSSDQAFLETLETLELISHQQTAIPEVERLKQAIIRYAHEPVAHSLATFSEAAKLSAATGLPAIFHTALPSVAKLYEVATDPANQGAVLVAGHMNHTSIAARDMLDWAKKLKQAGVIIDVSVLDGVSTRQLVTPKEQDMLIASGLVDTLSTDYAAGHWDSMLEAIQRWWRKGLLNLPEAVAMATSRPATLFPKAAQHRGLLAPGYFADIVITEEVNIGRVQTVIIDGTVVRQFNSMVPRHMDCCS